MRGTVSGVRRVDADNVEILIETDGGSEEAVKVPADKAGRFSMGKEVTFELKAVRKPRAKNGEGKRKKKNAD